MRLTFVALAASLLLAGCDDSVTAPRDQTPPAAPRGVFSVTGDGTVAVHWLANTEADVAGYRIYSSPCANGPDCPYDPVGATSGTSFVVTGLPNGVTRFYAVGAFDRAGNEGRLSKEDVYDTPRPAGYGRTLGDYVDEPAISGWDFSAALRRPFDDPQSDVYFGYSGGVYRLFAAYTDTDIQDAGFGASLDDVDWAPTGGWSPTGSVELIPGHNYVVWTRIGSPDVHYAKFRVTGLTPHLVTFDWAYQVAPGNRELRVRPAGPAGIQ